MLTGIGELACHAGEIALVERIAADLLVQADQRRALLGQHQDARGLPVEPVHQFREARFRMGLPQLFDDPEGDAGAAMDRHAGRFVDDQQVRILEQDGEARRRHEGGGRCGSRHANRRDPHHISRFQPVVASTRPC